MLKSLIGLGINSFEKKYRYDASYLKSMAQNSSSLFLKFNQFTKLSKFRKFAPADVLYVAKVAALKNIDCGPCLQLNLRFAKEQGIPAQVLKQAVESPDGLPEPLRIAYDFAEAICRSSDDLETKASVFEKAYGKNARVELALAVATAQVYPMIKRGLGMSESCGLRNSEY